MSVPVIIGPRNSPAAAYLVPIITGLEKRLAQGAVARSNAAKYDTRAATLWNQFQEANPGAWLLAEGCQVFGLTIWIDHGLYVRWRTAPAAGRSRFPTGPAPEGPVPLGTYQGWELSAAFEGPETPLLIATNSPAQELIWKLFQHGPTPDAKRPAPLREALRRAVLVNCFAATQWAKPCPYGTVGIPSLPSRPSAE